MKSVEEVHSRWEGLQEGSNLAKAAETIFIKFSFDSQAALNSVGKIGSHIIQPQLTRHINEIYHQFAAKEASLGELQAGYDKWSWVLVGIISSS